MKIKLSFTILLVVAFIAVLFFPTQKVSKIEKLRNQHSEYLKNHDFNESLKLTKPERKKLGIPPNKYFEEQYLLEINPATGEAEFDKKFALQKKLLGQSSFKSIPGSDDNAWVERGPNNVPGRTRAILFDPNDASGERVFAGGVSGGLWVNDNISNQNSGWVRVGIPENLAVSSISVDPNNSQIMYLGTGESYVQGDATGNGIYRSMDGGTSWTNVFASNQGTSFFNGGSTVTVNSPVNIAGDITAVVAGFGPAFTAPISGDLVIVDDGTADAIEGCNTLGNGALINGNIAVIERGSCNFTVKVKNAQDQGAIAVLMINNVDGNPITMGGTDDTITIPSLMISKDNGTTILNELSSQTVNVTLSENSDNIPSGVVLVPGVYHVNDIVTRDNGGATEIYAAVADGTYQEAPRTLLGQGTEYGLYRSTDEGVSWTQLDLPLTTDGNRYEPNDIEIAVDNTIWVSTTNSSSYGDGGGTIFSSTDGAIFIEKYVVPNGNRTEIEISETDPNKIYVLAQANPLTMLRTLNSFTTTETLQLPDDADNGIDANDFTRGQAFYDLMIEADPTNDDIVYVGGIDMFRSTTGGVGATQGAAWTQISKWSNNANLNTLNVPLVHADIHELSFDPSNPDKAIVATDGGVYYANSLMAANNSGTAIFSSFRDYNTTQFYWGAIGQDENNDQILGGAQDNGSSFVSNGTSGVNTFTDISGGDGGYCFIDKDGAYLITSFTFNNFNRFNLPNTNNRETIVDDDDTGGFINVADLDDNLDILYTNGTSSTEFQISRFENVDASSPTRVNFTNALLTSSPTVIDVSEFTTNSSVLFVGTITGRVLKVTGANNAPSWTDITGPEFVGSISDISLGNSENEIFVTFHNYGVKSIWFTDDGGVTWQDKEGDFPDIPVKAILMNPLLNNEVIIGTDLGVWRTDNFTDTDPTWVQSQNGMQNVKVTSFDLRISDNTVLASTYGRGLFTGKFDNLDPETEETPSEEDTTVLFPNPSNGNITVKTTIDFGQSKFTVFDVTGKLVFSQEETFLETIELDLSNLNTGLYIFNIEGENSSFNRKIFIE